MDRRRIIDGQLYTHFITFGVERRRRLLELDHPKRIVLKVLNHQLESFEATCVGFVLMPNHVHALIWFQGTGQLTRFMYGWKRMSSFEIRNWYRTTAPAYFAELGEGDRFWQPKFYSFEIDNEKTQEVKLDYIHQNPVRAGLVTQATDWKWSSARWYAHQQSVGVPIQWIR